jgi:hypothetical protein
MRIATPILVLTAAGFLAACNSEEACTPELAQQKSTELTAKITELGTTDPAKLAELTPRLQELTTQAAAGGDDLNAACKAMDEMLAELNQ